VNKSLNGTTSDRLNLACEILRQAGSVVVAFSGGVDSAFVLKLAVDTLGAKNVLAVTGRSPSLAAAELNDARGLADSLGVEHLVIDTDEFANPNYVANPINRCYFCKTTLYTHLERIRAERGFAAVVNGTNADDLGDHRPGLTAASEFNVRAPAAEATLNKIEIRELSRSWGLPTHDKPAAPCLSSRVQYGETITPEKLRMIEAAESYLRNDLGIRECRVRHHDHLARIEVPPEYIPILADPASAEKLNRRFREIGYRYVALDLHGFRSGSMNEVIEIGRPHTDRFT
jgi:uncharacterized protein